MTKERLAGAIKVGFAQGRVDYTETVYDDLICLETDGESRHAAMGKYYVKSTVFEDRVLTSRHLQTPYCRGLRDKRWPAGRLLPRLSRRPRRYGVCNYLITLTPRPLRLRSFRRRVQLTVLGDFKDWMALAFVRQILMFDKFEPSILAVIKGRMTGAEACCACMKDAEEQPEEPSPEPEALDVIEHKFDQPRDAESDIRRRNRRR